MCTVAFYTSVRSIAMPDGDTAYHSKVLCLTVRYSKNLLADIRDNYVEWLTMAVEDAPESDFGVHTAKHGKEKDNDNR